MSRQSSNGARGEPGPGVVWCICGTQVVRREGRAHAYWRLVRSVRRGGKVVQETVAQLGELDAEGRASARSLAPQLLGAGQQRELFEDLGGGEQGINVRLDRVRVERARAFGGCGWGVRSGAH